MSRRFPDHYQLSVEATFPWVLSLTALFSAELMGSLKLGNVWVFVQLIHRPRRAKNQQYNNPNIAQLETSYVSALLLSLPAFLFCGGVEEREQNTKKYSNATWKREEEKTC